MLRVLVNGADGRMGSQVVKAVFEDPELEVAGGISITHVGEDVGDIAGVGHLGLTIRDDLGAALDDIKPDVVVDSPRRKSSSTTLRPASNTVSIWSSARRA